MGAVEECIRIGMCGATRRLLRRVTEKPEDYRETFDRNGAAMATCCDPSGASISSPLGTTPDIGGVVDRALVTRNYERTSSRWLRSQ
jgi:hypothetical protein